MTRGIAANNTIPPETPNDHRETEDVVMGAFWNLCKPSCNEQLVVHRLRHPPGFVREPDFVACDGDRIVGKKMCAGALLKAET